MCLNLLEWESSFPVFPSISIKTMTSHVSTIVPNESSATSVLSPTSSNITDTLSAETFFSTYPQDLLPVNGQAAFLPWDNPDNVISHETYAIITTISNCFVYPLLFLVGVPTNVLNCVVFRRQGLGDRMNLCLFCLALIDMFYLFVLIVQAASTFVTFVDEVVGAEYYAQSLVSCLGVGWGFKAASGCISAVIAVERCVCVVRPFAVNSLMRTSTMGWLLAAIAVSTQVVGVFQPLAYTGERTEDKESGEVRWNIVTTELYGDNQVLFDFILVGFLRFGLPLVSFIVVSVATAITVVQLKVAARWRGDHSMTSHTGSRQQDALTVVLVLLSCIYIACAAPLVAVALVRVLVIDFSPEGRYSNICIASHVLGTVFSAVNSSVNFFVYYRMSSSYRKALHSLRGGS